MADLVTKGSTIQIPAGSIVNTIYRREYWLEEYYVEILKSQGPKYREFVLSDLFYFYLKFSVYLKDKYYFVLKKMDF